MCILGFPPELPRDSDGVNIPGLNGHRFLPRHGCEPRPMRIFLSAGEPSGDLHAANLIHALRRRRPGCDVRRLRRAADGGGGGGGALSARGAGGDVVRAGPDQPAQVPGAGLAGGPLLPPPEARRGRPDRLPGVPLVDRLAGQGPRDSRLLLRPAANLGVGRAGGSRRSASTSTTSCAASRSSPPGITPGASPARSTSGTPTSMSWPSGRSTRRSSPRSGPAGGRSWRSCPARGRRR